MFEGGRRVGVLGQVHREKEARGVHGMREGGRGERVPVEVRLQVV